MFANLLFMNYFFVHNSFNKELAHELFRAITLSRADFRMKIQNCGLWYRMYFQWSTIENTFNESLHKLCNGIEDQIRHGPRPVCSGYTTILSDRVPLGFVHRCQVI